MSKALLLKENVRDLRIIIKLIKENLANEGRKGYRNVFLGGDTIEFPERFKGSKILECIAEVVGKKCYEDEREVFSDKEDEYANDFACLVLDILDQAYPILKLI